LEISEGNNAPGRMTAKDFKMFRTLIHQKTGIWLRDGKEVMLSSRLSRRLREHAMTSFAEYYGYVSKLANDDEELRELINCVTTNKTAFFREEHHFKFLATKLVPELQRAASGGAAKTIRIWSAACSTGEEPYSIVIALLEALGTQASAWKVEVIASDIDTVVLGTAARGIYDIKGLESVETALHRRYFLRGKGELLGQVKIKPEVAGHVVFKNINLMDQEWPVEAGFDAIFFRNALIYFNQETQSLFLRRMVRLLKPKKYLMLGHSEHVPWLHDVVVPLNQTVYQVQA
jgi:chemotaxis protein methyltransferase CheR